MSDLRPPVLVRWTDASGQSHEQIFFGYDEARVASEALLRHHGTMVTTDLLINPIESKTVVIGS